MRRARLLGALYSLIIGIMVLAALCPAAAVAETTVSGRFNAGLKIYYLSVAEVGTNSATITWRTNGNATSQVTYAIQPIGTSGYSYVEYTSPVAIHTVYLTGLTPGFTYHFVAKSVATVNSSTAVSNEQTFTCAADSGGSETTNPPEETVTGIDIPIGEGTATATDTSGNSLTVTGGVITIAENTDMTGMSVYIPVKLESGDQLQSFTDSIGITFADNTLVVPTGSITAKNTSLYFTIEDNKGDLDTVLVIKTGDVVGTGTKAVAPVKSVEGAHSAYATKDFTPEEPSLGEVASAIDVQINELPRNSTIHIDTSLAADPTASSAFQLAAASIGMEKFETAYVINVTRIDIQNGKNIKSATIKMKAGDDWVKAHGGTDAIKILRYDNEKNITQVLETRFIGYDAQGRAEFEGVSPDGLSVFALIGKEAQSVEIASDKPTNPATTPNPVIEPPVIVIPTPEPIVVPPKTPPPIPVPVVVPPVTVTPGTGPTSVVQPPVTGMPTGTPVPVPAPPSVTPYYVWPIVVPVVTVFMLALLLLSLLAGKKWELLLFIILLGRRPELEVVFTTPPQIIKSGRKSSTIVVQLHDKRGKPHKVNEDTQIRLVSTSSTGRFYAEPGSGLDVSENVMTVPKGTDKVTFYYRDEIPGTPTIEAVFIPVKKVERKGKKRLAGMQDATVYIADVSQLAFVTKPQKITAGEVSKEIIVQTQDAYGNPIEVSSDTVVNLKSTSLTGRFDISADGPFDGSVTSVIIPAGSSSAGFYFKDVLAVISTIFAVGIPSKGWSGVVQQQTIVAAAIDRIEFITAPRTIAAGAVSRVIFIQTKDQFGNPVNVSKNTNIKLTSTSATGRFDISAGGQFSDNETTVVITSGSNSACFYYKDTVAGEPVITAASGKNQDWTEATQQQMIQPVEE